MNYHNLTLPELMREADNQPGSLAEAICKLLPDDPDTLQDRLEATEDELQQTYAEIRALELKLEHFTNALQGLRIRTFGVGCPQTTLRSLNDDQEFRVRALCGSHPPYTRGEGWDFFNTHQELKPIQEEYCPDMGITAAYRRLDDGEITELWVTEDARYFDTNANYVRVR